MADDLNTGTPRQQTEREEMLTQLVLQTFREIWQWKSVFSSHCEEVAELILPTFRNTFQFGSWNTPGQKKTDRQVDATGMMALSRFAAICDSLLTPSNSYWHGLEAMDDYVMKDRATRLWFDAATKMLFKYRYMAEANFIAQNQAKYQMIGAFGNSALFIDDLDQAATGRKGVRYKSIPFGELYFKENHQGLVDTVIRWFRLTARQAHQRWPETFPETLRPALNNNSEQLFDFFHMVAPNPDFEFGRLDAKGKRYRSLYVCDQSKSLLQEGGYRTFPYEIQRYDQAPQEVYGRGPAMMVLPALKTLNAEKRTFLKQGHRAADPVLLAFDDGLLTFDMAPGAYNPGGMNSEGKKLVDILPTGNIQINKEMMDEERSLINDAFLVTLFQILTETPTMSATEVIERTNEKGILLAPTVGRLRPDAMVMRELDVLQSLNVLPPMPPRLKEAKSALGVVFTSPLAKAMKAQEAAGFFRTLEGVKEIVAVTGDHTPLDRFDFDTAVPAIAQIQSVPELWMADDNKVAAKRKARADAQQRQEMIQAAPAAAAMMKARAATGGQGGGVQAAPAQAPAAPGAPLTSVS